MIRAIFLTLSIAALAATGASTATAQTCANPVNGANGAADLDGNGCVDQADKDLMIQAVQTGDPVGDMNNTGTVNTTDWNLFMAAYDS